MNLTQIQCMGVTKERKIKRAPGLTSQINGLILTHCLDLSVCRIPYPIIAFEIVKNICMEEESFTDWTIRDINFRFQFGR